MSGDTVPVRGPRFAAAARLPIQGQKRRRVLALIAAYADAGIDNPSIRVLAERAALDRYVTLGVVDALERDGLLTVERGDSARKERNRYRLLFPVEVSA